MEISKTINFQDGAALRRLLAQQRNITGRFNIGMPRQDLARALASALEVETMRCQRRLEIDDTLRQNIVTIADWLGDARACPGLLLTGLYGNGKTSMLRAICNVIYTLSRMTNDFSDRTEMPFVTARKIAWMAATQEMRKQYRKLTTTPLLAIDDLGEEPSEVTYYGMPTVPLVDLLEERYERRLLTVISTNLRPDEISAKYGARIADRFREMMKPVVYSHDSYRRSASRS